jgi:hypothetical protein
MSDVKLLNHSAAEDEIEDQSSMLRQWSEPALTKLMDLNETQGPGAGLTFDGTNFS